MVIINPSQIPQFVGVTSTTLSAGTRASCEQASAPSTPGLLGHEESLGWGDREVPGGPQSPGAILQL